MKETEIELVSSEWRGGEAMLEVYNYMISNYLPKPNERYQLHKRGELRNLYKSIQNISKSSPFYKINLSKENQQYTLSVKESSLEMKELVGHLTGENDVKLFECEKIISSNPEVAKATVFGKVPDKLPSKFMLQVQQLAQSQKNVGKSKNGKVKGMDPGVYRLTLSTNEGNTSFNVFFHDKTTHYDQLNTIMDEINRQDVGVRAKVVKEEREDYYHMELYGDDMVKLDCCHFQLLDDLKEDGVAEYYGLNQMEVKPKEALFQINGSIKSARVNQFTIADSIEFELKDITEEPVTFQLFPEEEKIEKAIREFTDSYNTLISTAWNRMQTTTECIGAAKLFHSYQSLTNMYSDQLKSCGIKVLEDGSLQIEEDSLKEIIQNGTLEENLKVKPGFFDSIQRKSSEVSINPVEYLDKIIVTYPNTKQATYANPYITSMYSGMFFNYYC